MIQLTIYIFLFSNHTRIMLIQMSEIESFFFEYFAPAPQILRFQVSFLLLLLLNSRKKRDTQKNRMNAVKFTRIDHMIFGDVNGEAASLVGIVKLTHSNTYVIGKNVIYIYICISTKYL